MNTQYVKPETLIEALSLLDQGGAGVMAGGTDVLVRQKKGIALPPRMIDLKSLPELKLFDYDEALGLRMGALTTMDTLEHNPIVKREYTALAESAAVLASPTIRKAATVAGNICNAAPSAETTSPLIVLGASVKLVGLGTERIIPVEEMFVGPGKTVLESREIVSEIILPKRPENSASCYLKQVRRYGADLAVVGIAVSLELENGVMKNVRIAEGAVAPTVIRAKEAEQMLEGKAPSQELIEAAAAKAAEEAKPITDVRGTKEFRREIVRVLTKRAVETTIQRI